MTSGLRRTRWATGASHAGAVLTSATGVERLLARESRLTPSPTRDHEGSPVQRGGHAARYMAVNSSSPASWLRAHVFALSSSLVVGAGFVWLLRAGALPVLPGAAAWGGVHDGAVLGYIALFAAVHLLRCVRWSLLVSRVERPSFGLSLGIGLLGSASLVILPFRLGEAVRPALVHSRAKLPLGTSAGVMAAERIVDGLVLSVLLCVALLGARTVSPLPDHIGALPVPARLIPSVAWVGVGVFGGLALAMVALHGWHAVARTLIERHLGRFSPQLTERASRAVASVANGFRFLNDAQAAPAFAFFTGLYWALNVAGIWLLLWGTGVPAPSLAQATVILGVLGLGLVVPNAPGFFGTFQISIYSAMVLFYPLDVVTGAGAAFVFLLYVVQMAVILIGAVGVLVWGRLSNAE
jgi:uncharacterized protein (TIRG00374 family)